MRVIKFLGLVLLLTGCNSGGSGVEDSPSPNDLLSTEDTDSLSTENIVLADAGVIDSTGMVEVPEEMLRGAFRTGKVWSCAAAENQELVESPDAESGLAFSFDPDSLAYTLWTYHVEPPRAGPSIVSGTYNYIAAPTPDTSSRYELSNPPNNSVFEDVSGSLNDSMFLSTNEAFDHIRVTLRSSWLACYEAEYSMVKVDGIFISEL